MSYCFKNNYLGRNMYKNELFLLKNFNPPAPDPRPNENSWLRHCKRLLIFLKAVRWSSFFPPPISQESNSIILPKNLIFEVIILSYTISYIGLEPVEKLTRKPFEVFALIHLELNGWVLFPSSLLHLHRSQNCNR